MNAPTLVIMAAGIGSRYGGIKQIDPVGPGGEIILDYSVYDALSAGFSRVVFIIRREIEGQFRDVIGRRIEDRIEVRYVFQELSNLPDGYCIPEGRVKPWGTAHAVLSVSDSLTAPFAVINADDFYGSKAIRAMGDYLSSAHDNDGVYDYCMVGYELQNTLSDNGDVARGVCRLTQDGYLAEIQERTRIQRFEDGIKYTENGTDWLPLEPDAIVSLNLWGFTPSVMAELEMRFEPFLKQNAEKITKAEFLLPDVVGCLVKEGKARVKVLPAGEIWYGVTYREDRPVVQAAIQEMVERGFYPERLWS